jgi:hypothetical protein
VLIDILTGDAPQEQAEEREAKRCAFKAQWCAENGYQYVVLTDELLADPFGLEDLLARPSPSQARRSRRPSPAGGHPEATGPSRPGRPPAAGDTPEAASDSSTSPEAPKTEAPAPARRRGSPPRAPRRSRAAPSQDARPRGGAARCSGPGREPHRHHRARRGPPPAPGRPLGDATPVPYNLVRLEQLGDQIPAVATPTQRQFLVRFAGVPTEQYVTVQVIPATLVAYVDGSPTPVTPTVDVDRNGNFTLPGRAGRSSRSPTAGSTSATATSTGSSTRRAAG